MFSRDRSNSRGPLENAVRLIILKTIQGLPQLSWYQIIQKRRAKGQQINNNARISNPILNLLSPKPASDLSLGIQPLEMARPVRAHIAGDMQPFSPLVARLIPGIVFRFLIGRWVMLHIGPEAGIEVLQRQKVLLPAHGRDIRRLLFRRRRLQLRRRLRRRPLVARDRLQVPVTRLGQSGAYCDLEPFIAGSESRYAGGGDAEEDFPRAPVPIGDTPPGRIVGLVLPV